jgi:PAS domain S-box-containing protein
VAGLVVSILKRISLTCGLVMLLLTVLLCFLIANLHERNTVDQAKGDFALHVQAEAQRHLTEEDFSSPRRGKDYDETRERIKDIAGAQGNIMTVVFSPDGTIAWSDLPSLVGRRFPDENLLGKESREKSAARITTNENEKEILPLAGATGQFLEIHVPVSLSGSRRTTGAIKLYKNIGGLRASIFRTNAIVTATIFASFAVLYGILFAIVRRASGTIERNREELLRSRENIQTHRAEMLKRIGVQVLEESDLDTVLGEVSREVCGLVDIPRCVIRIFGDPDRVYEHCIPGFPSSRESLSEVPRPPDFREIRADGKAFVVCDIRDIPSFRAHCDLLGRIRLGAYIAAPLVVQEDSIGVLFLDREEAHSWTKDEIETAEILARRIAVAVRHARVFRKQEELAGRLLSLMNNVPGVVYRGKPDWSVTFMGADIWRVVGHSSEDITSRRMLWNEIIHPDDRERVRGRVRDAVRAREKVLRLEYRVLHKDGKVRWTADRRQLIYNSEGALLYVDGLILDITDRKKAEEALRLTQFAVDRSGDAAYWMGPGGEILYVNEQACATLGYEREELLAKRIQDINPDFPDDVWTVHWEGLRQRKSFIMETRHRSKDGRLIPVEVTANYVEFDGQEYNCASARNITERVRAQEERHLLEAQLLQSQKMEAIGILAGGIAHDFNNLLTGILGYANLLRYNSRAGSEVATAADVILDAAERAGNLTAQLLGFARKGKNLTVPVDIHETISDVTILLERTLEKKIRIRTSFSPDTALVIGDPTQLQQVVMNLAMNARDAMPEGGDLTITTDIAFLDEAFCRSHPGAPAGRCILLEVADTGMGIPPEHLEKIFDPFFTTKVPGKGTGLGLSMVFGIVKNHGGYITVESRIGNGTAFKIYLPASAAQAAVASDRSLCTESGGSGNGRGRVLLIDDQETVREVCSAMLRTLGYRVETASDGREGVEHYRLHGRDIDLVIIDMIMPNLGGRDCFREIRTMNPGVRAILSTGYSMDGSVQEIMDEGMIGFLKKPYRLDQLSSAVAQAIGRDN